MNNIYSSSGSYLGLDFQRDWISKNDQNELENSRMENMVSGGNCWIEIAKEWLPLLFQSVKDMDLLWEKKTKFLVKVLFILINHNEFSSFSKSPTNSTPRAATVADRRSIASRN